MEQACIAGILAKSFRLLPMDAFVGEILLAKGTRDLIDDYDKIRKGVSLPSEPFPSPLACSEEPSHSAIVNKQTPGDT